MDYDSTDIPAGYDRGRDHGPELLALWMATVERSIGSRPHGVIADLGCGTGRFSDALATHFAALVVGIDPSTKMLAQACAKRHLGEVRYVRGAGEAMPLSDASVDAVFSSMVVHHFQDPPRAARECRRIVRPGGRVMLRTATRDRIAHYPYVPFFPSSVPLLEDRLPTAAFIADVFQDAGFRLDACELIVQTIASDLMAYASKLAAGGDSVLASLPPADFEAGLSAMRTRASQHDTAAVAEPIDFFVFAPA